MRAPSMEAPRVNVTHAWGWGGQRPWLAFNHPKHGMEGEEILEASINIKRVVLYIRSHLCLINDYCTF